MTTEVLYTYGPSFAGALLIATAQLLAGKKHFLERHDGAGLDFLAGIAVAYVFVDILPHLAAKQEKFAKLGDGGIYGFLQHHIYILALAGFLIYLGVILSEGRWRKSLPAGGVTWANARLSLKIEAVSLAAYSFIIGYMLAEQPTHRYEPSLVFAAAMAAHFVGLGHLFHHRYPQVYDGAGRYLLIAALLAGWLLGFFVEMSGVYYAATFAFLAGGVISVTTIFELPRVTSTKRYGSFASGAVAFTLTVLLLESVRAMD